MLKFADKENLVQQKKADTTNTIENVNTDSINNTYLYDSLKDNINTVQKKPSSVESSNKKIFQAKTSDVMQMKSNSNVVQKVDDPNDFSSWNRAKRIISRALFKKHPKFVYRSDSRSPEAIINQGGFKSRNENSQSTLLEHVGTVDIDNSGHETSIRREGESKRHLNTNFVSTASARAFIKTGRFGADNIFGNVNDPNREVYLYKISTKDGEFIDALDYFDRKGFTGTNAEKNAAKDSRKFYKNQREFASKGSIPLTSIISYVGRPQVYELLAPERPFKSEKEFHNKFSSLETKMPVPNGDNQPVIQGKFKSSEDSSNDSIIQKKSNNTGLPDNLKSGIENLSGYSMDDVKVHYNSPKPTQMKALAYTQGTDIHVAPGQEKHLGHEAWHVVQQKQGRVQPTTQMKGVNINDNSALEHEADIMGAKATQLKAVNNTATVQKKVDNNEPIQFFRTYYYENGDDGNHHIEKDAAKASGKRAMKELYGIDSINGLFNDFCNDKSNQRIENDVLKEYFIQMKGNDAFIKILDNQITKNENAIKYYQYLENCQTKDDIDHVKYGQLMNAIVKCICDCRYQLKLASNSNECDIIKTILLLMPQVKNSQEIYTFFNNPIYKLEQTNGQLGNTELLNKNENMIIVSHGARPLVGFLRYFAVGSPEKLASRIVSIIPDGYTGEIYLDGCHTGEPTALFNPKLNDGTSFAECFGKELVKLLKKSKKNASFRVKGNLGSAITTDEGKEKIELDEKSRDLAKQREALINSSIENVQTTIGGKDSLGRRNAIRLSKSQQEDYRKALDISLYNKKTSEDAHKQIEAAKYRIKHEERDSKGNRIYDSVSGSATKMIYHFST